MNDELVVSTPDEYVKLTTRKMRVPSGAVFELRGVSAGAMVYLLDIMPEEGLRNQREIVAFCGEYFAELVEQVIQPSIVAPKVEHLVFLDVVELLVKLMSAGGFTEEENKSFPDEEDSTDA